MVDRIDHILLCLVRHDGPLTAAEIASMVGVSDRTIKSSMRRVAEELASHGAELEAKRNCGYRVVVHDEARYSKLAERINLLAGHIMMKNYDKAERALHIERRLVGSDRGARIEEICDELSLSRTAVRSALKAATRFCESYHLEVSSSPQQGMRVSGEEHMVRLALMELFEVHFHTYCLDTTVREYARWIWCDYQERQDIRHEFLHHLRGSGIALRDSSTQRISMYLIIARNRIASGYRVHLPVRWVEEIKSSLCYGVAVDILSALEYRFHGFGFANDETAFFAILLLCNMDTDLARDVRAVSPYLYPDVHRAACASIHLLRMQTGIDLASMAGAQACLEQCLLGNVAMRRYDMDGFEVHEYDVVRSVVRDPLCLFFGAVLAHVVGSVLDCRMSQADICSYTALFQWIMQSVPLPIRPKRLLVTNTMGTEYARLVARNIKQAFPETVESARACELYEIREIDAAAYDAVVTNSASSYRYDAPYAAYRDGLSPIDLTRIYETVLIDAYSCYPWLPNEETVRVHNDVRVDSIAQVMQALALDEERRGQHAVRRVQGLHETLISMQECSPCWLGILISLVDGSRAGLVEWYNFAKPISAGAEKMRACLTVRLPASTDMPSLAMWRRSLAHVADSSEALAVEVPRDVLKVLERAFRTSLLIHQ